MMTTISFNTEKYQFVPKVPSAEMLSSGCLAGLSFGALTDDARFSTERAIWTAMLATAPTLNGGRQE